MRKNIVIMNLHGAYNLGDQAIQESGMEFLKEFIKENNIYLLCVDKDNFHSEFIETFNFNKEYSPYGYAIRSKDKKIKELRKLTRFTKIISLSILLSLLGKINYNILPNKSFYRYISFIRKSDYVILMGGGYFVSKNRYKDLFGVILTVLPTFIAKLYHKPILILPVSFGPYASITHEYITGQSIKNTMTLIRDPISFEIIKKYNNRSILTSDLALYDFENSMNDTRDNYYVLTLREYFAKAKQLNFEEEIYKFIQQFWKKSGMKCIFIPMAFNSVEDNDMQIAYRLSKKINDPTIFEIHSSSSYKEAKKVLSSAKLAICMRMHSAILSSNVLTPFICLSYEHKIRGFLNTFGLNHWQLDPKTLTSQDLNNLINQLLEDDNYIKVKSIIKQKHEYLSETKNLLNIQIRSYFGN